MWEVLAVFVVILQAVSSDHGDGKDRSWVVKIGGGPVVEDNVAHRNGIDDLGLVRVFLTYSCSYIKENFSNVVGVTD